MDKAWPYRASVIAHSDATTILTRLPPSTLVEPMDEATCSVHVGADSPFTLVPWLGMLDADSTSRTRKHIRN